MRALFVLALLASAIAVASAAEDLCAISSVDSGLEPYYSTNTAFTNNHFNLVVAVPKSYKNPSLAFTGTGVAADCYATADWAVSALTTSGSTDSCYQFYTLDAIWANLYSKCGVSRSVSTEHVEFKLTIQLDAVQTFTADSGAEEQVLEGYNRPLSNLLALKIKFPRFSTATSIDTVTNLLSGDKVPGQAVLVYSKVTGDGENIANTYFDMRVLTVLTYPDEVASVAYDTSAGYDSSKFTVVTPAEATSLKNCTAQPGGQCRQFFNLKVNLVSAAVCTFNGDYKLVVTLKCQDGYTGDCSSPKSFSVTFKVKTLDHCPKLTTADLTATMATYGGSDYASTTSTYQLRQFAYGKLVSASTSADIESTKIVKLVLSQAKDTSMSAAPSDIVMFDNSADSTTPVKTAAGAFARCELTDSTAEKPSDAKFKCKLTTAQVIIAAGASRAVTWTATALVSFKNTGGAASRRLLTVTMKHRHDMVPLSISSSDSAVASALNLIVAPAEEAMVAASSAFLASPSVFFFTIISMIAGFFVMMM